MAKEVLPFFFKEALVDDRCECVVCVKICVFTCKDVLEFAYM